MNNDKGSVIIILATDIPMTNRQLKRVCKRTAAECTEEAVLNSLICADTTKGRMNRIKYSLKEYINEIILQIVKNKEQAVEECLI